jgi:hypothetical protein
LSDDDFVDLDLDEIGDDLCTATREEHGEGKFVRGKAVGGKYAHVGVKKALAEPVSDGRRIAFVDVSIVDGSYHEWDTDEPSVHIAAYFAVRDALTRARLVDV